MNQDDYFILPEGIQFGFNDKYYDERVLSVVDNRLTVIRCNNGKITGGVVFGEKPLMGLAEVEIEILTSSTGKRVSSSLLFGVMRCKKGTIPYQGHNKLSRYDIDISTEKNHLIWSENKQLWNLLGAKIELNTSYGIVNLKDLEEGDRLGLQIQENGDLYYFVNGMCQGLAAHHVYQKGWDVYHVVDISNDHYGIKITKAVMQNEVPSLQHCCIRLIVQTLICETQAGVNQLSLPPALKDRIISYSLAFHGKHY